MDECLDETLNNCSEFATCQNKNGSFECLCNTGYIFPPDGPFDGTICEGDSTL